MPRLAEGGAPVFSSLAEAEKVWAIPDCQMAEVRIK